jgi:hypothetical protein
MKGYSVKFGERHEEEVSGSKTQRLVKKTPLK